MAKISTAEAPVVEADRVAVTVAAAVATTGAALEVAAAVAGVVMFAAVDVMATSAFPDINIQDLFGD